VKRNRRPERGLLWPAATLVLAACAARTGTRTARAGDECVPRAPAQLSGVRWDGLAGDWRVALVATVGPRSGSQSVGTLALQVQDAALLRFGADSNTTVPVYGTARLALDEVGAQAFGDLGSASAAAPGVALYVSDGSERGVTAIMRFGSGANRRDLLPFEGVYTALFVRRVDRDRVFGVWTSSSGEGAAAGGHFCLVRDGS
jgi:hypothetical protein